MLASIVSKSAAFVREHLIERKSSTSGVANPEAWLADLLGGIPSASGVAVSADTAMRSTPVRCAVQSIAEAIGQLPVHVYSRSDDGAKERAPEHPVYRLLHDEANDWTPASDFREQLTRDALLHGNGFAFINRVEGRPIELNRLDPKAISVSIDDVTGEPVYSVSAGRTSSRVIDRANILHIKAPSLDGVSGESPVKLAREAIGLALVMEAHAARLFGNGARPSGLLSFPNSLNPEAQMRVKTAWNAAHGGTKSGGTAVIGDGAKYEQLGFSSVDAQFLELWQHVILEIARAFRVPPILLMDYGRATWGNSEEMGRQFVTFTLMRWIKAWEGEVRLKLFPVDQRDRFFVEFLIDDLLKADIAKRAEAYSKLIAARVLNPNEVRALENRPPYEGGDIFANPNTTSGNAPPAEPIEAA